MSRTDHFPRLVLSQPIQTSPLQGRETVEEFIARGGRIHRVPFGVSGIPIQVGKLSQREHRDRIRMDGIARRNAR